MTLQKVAEIPVEAIEPAVGLSVTMLRRLGASIFRHKRREEEAHDASKAVDYLVRKGVISNDKNT